MDESIERYILDHIDDEGDYLRALYRDTHVKLLRPRMASGHLQGRMLKMFVRMIRPKNILELGTFTGYSALSLADGMTGDGELHTIEIDDELEDDLYCEHLVETYLNDPSPDKHETISLEELARREGIEL